MTIYYCIIHKVSALICIKMMCVLKANKMERIMIISETITTNDGVCFHYRSFNPSIQLKVAYCVPMPISRQVICLETTRHCLSSLDSNEAWLSG